MTQGWIIKWKNGSDWDYSNIYLDKSFAVDELQGYGSEPRSSTLWEFNFVDCEPLKDKTYYIFEGGLTAFTFGIFDDDWVFKGKMKEIYEEAPRSVERNILINQILGKRQDEGRHNGLIRLFSNWVPAEIHDIPQYKIFIEKYGSYLDKESWSKFAIPWEQIKGVQSERFFTPISLKIESPPEDFTENISKKSENKIKIRIR